MQLDFLNQKCEIEKFIINSVNSAYHFIILYLKYQFELNYIEHF